jgi:cytochrome c-type biogenesis protein CcmH/NrfG
MLTRCRKCKASFFGDMQYCPNCGQKRQSNFERYGFVAALIFCLLAAVVVRYMSLKFYQQPTIDPAALKPLSNPPPAKAPESEPPRFR